MKTRFSFYLAYDADELPSTTVLPPSRSPELRPLIFNSRYTTFYLVFGPILTISSACPHAHGVTLATTLFAQITALFRGTGATNHAPISQVAPTTRNGYASAIMAFFSHRLVGAGKVKFSGGAAPTPKNQVFFACMAFLSVGGQVTHFWLGESLCFCLTAVYNLGRRRHGTYTLPYLHYTFHAAICVVNLVGLLSDASSLRGVYRRLFGDPF